MRAEDAMWTTKVTMSMRIFFPVLHGSAIRLAGQLDEGDERYCALFLFAVSSHRHVRLANRQRPSRFDHMAARDQQWSIPRSQQVEFELNCEDRRFCIHQRVGCVACGVVRDGPDGTRVKKAMLLAELFPVGEMDLTIARMHGYQLGPKQLYKALPSETGPYPIFIVGIRRLK